MVGVKIHTATCTISNTITRLLQYKLTEIEFLVS